VLQCAAMPWAAGARIGGYEIVGALGAGGMGEVYRARDVRLQREVALKILPALFVADPERLARFEREARVLASLNHTHIAAIYGVEEGSAGSGRVPVLVLELVDGETLQERMTRGAIPVEDALAIALQIARALEVAHERDIVHRDLKPANIKIPPEGHVKVLDFGLAKAYRRPFPGSCRARSRGRWQGCRPSRGTSGRSAPSCMGCSQGRARGCPAPLLYRANRSTAGRSTAGGAATRWGLVPAPLRTAAASLGASTSSSAPCRSVNGSSVVE